MTKQELLKTIKELIEPETTPDPDNMSDGELLDIIYDLVRSEEAQVKDDWLRQTNKEIREGNV